jgi:hypothetical protein
MHRPDADGYCLLVVQPEALLRLPDRLAAETYTRCGFEQVTVAVTGKALAESLEQRRVDLHAACRSRTHATDCRLFPASPKRCSHQRQARIIVPLVAVFEGLMRARQLRAVSASVSEVKGARRRPAVVALASMLAMTWPLSACGGSTTDVAQPGSIGAFASYIWTGAVGSVHAAWHVPEIEEGSPCGVAGTWIGASAEGRGFIQIGTNEECLKPTNRSLKLPLEASYYAFWSDTSKGYHPRALYEVQPGNLIEATLELTHRKWRLTIVDDSSGAKASFTSSEETQRAPYQADWAQEDVLLPNAYAPYPHLSEVEFSHVLVNGSVPVAEQLEPTGMSLGNETLAPTPLHDDSFAVRADE